MNLPEAVLLVTPFQALPAVSGGGWGQDPQERFRHCFEDACRDSDISKEVMDTLQGHGEEGMSGRYGRGFFLKKPAEAMARLRYEGLDLSHLRPKILMEKSERSPDQAAE